jgi:hypothetical protein
MPYGRGPVVASSFRAPGFVVQKAGGIDHQTQGQAVGLHGLRAMTDAGFVEQVKCRRRVATQADDTGKLLRTLKHLQQRNAYPALGAPATMASPGSDREVDGGMALMNKHLLCVKGWGKRNKGGVFTPLLLCRP